jgi:DNA excision repair protein ERCC-2
VASKKSITLAVRDFAIPSPRQGHIEVNSGYGQIFGSPLALAAEGRDLHAKIQKARQRKFAAYRSEVKVAHKFESDSYIFNVSGRVDGLVDGLVPEVEEIKSSVSPAELLSRLKTDHDHPYALQLATYAYILYLEKDSAVIPRTRFLITSNNFEEVEELDYKFDPAFYEKWLERRLKELEAQVKEEEKAVKRRRAIAEKLSFPFANPRPGQKELIHELEADLGLPSASSSVIVQAPTGLGKTMGVMYPVLKEAFSRGERVIYVTPKNSQHSVAQEALQKLRDVTRASEEIAVSVENVPYSANAPAQPVGGSEIMRSVTLNAKAKMCLKDEVICNPSYCQYARDYYEKVDSNNLVARCADMGALSVDEFKEMGRTYEVCPFELSLDTVAAADVVIGDYNYVFSPRNTLGRFTYSLSKRGEKPNLIIDEAHNLPQRASDYYSKALSSLILSKFNQELSALPFSEQIAARAALSKVLFCISDIGRMVGFKESRITVSRDLNNLETHCLALQEILAKRASSSTPATGSDNILESKNNKDSKESKGDPLSALVYYLNDFMEAVDYEGPEFFHLYTRNKQRDGTVDETLKVVCCDASSKLKIAHKEFAKVVAFSATIKPFQYFAQLSGFEPDQVICREYVSPFPKEHRKFMVIPQISTKYSDRERNYNKIADAVARIATIKPGNYFVFFPSFVFLSNVYDLIKDKLPASFLLLKQESEISRERASQIIASLSNSPSPTLVFAVQGGVFAEGVDYPGEMIIGAFIVGPGLPNYNYEREQIRDYYEKRYGSGFEYAYVYPAMAKVIQAAGRVIRSDQDRGIIVLMDQRFIQKQYVAAMPEGWFDADKGIVELVSKSIVSDVEHFWKSQEKCVL